MLRLEKSTRVPENTALKGPELENLCNDRVKSADYERDLRQGRCWFNGEWAYHFRDDLKGALAIALTLHEFFRHTDFIDMAGYTMATGWLDYNRTHSTISTRGQVFQLFNQHYGSIPVAVDGNSPPPAPQYPTDQPRPNSRHPYLPL